MPEQGADGASEGKLAKFGIVRILQREYHASRKEVVQSTDRNTSTDRNSRYSTVVYIRSNGLRCTFKGAGNCVPQPCRRAEEGVCGLFV